jgi:hypothetical protein
VETTQVAWEFIKRFSKSANITAVDDGEVVTAL